MNFYAVYSSTAVQDTATLYVDYAIAIPLPSNVTLTGTSQEQAEQFEQLLLDGQILDKGLHNAGEQRIYALEDYPSNVQAYLAEKGVNVGDTIEGVFIPTVGKNKFDKNLGIIDDFPSRERCLSTAALGTPIFNILSYLSSILCSTISSTK